MTFRYRKWAPEELCEYHKDWVKNYPDLNNEGLQILEQLITNKQMESIWVKLEKLAVRKQIQAPDYYFGLFRAIEPSGPYGIDRVTENELGDAVKDIKTKSRELTYLVRRVMPYAFINNAPKTRDNLLINVLENIGDQARDVLSQPRTLSDPGSTDANVNYFILQLSVFFTQTFGKPMDPIVAELLLIFMPKEKNINAKKEKDITAMVANKRRRLKNKL